MHKTRHILLLLFPLCIMLGCNTSEEKTPELILAADREAPIGWVNFNAYADHTFKYSLSRNTIYEGTYILNGDTLLLSCSDSTIGINKVAINKGSLEFFGKASPGFAGISVNKITEKAMDNSNPPTPTENQIKLHKLEKLFAIGDFDGDQKPDTIYQHNYSGLTKTEIINAADPFQNEWDSVIKWFYDQDADVYLTINNTKQDTLHLGTAQGLYCLINIGDNNADGKDEIAIVIDYLDFSRVNSCKIYSFCKNKWTLLKQFDIHEDSFNFNPDKAPTFTEIKDFLEHKNGKWVYKDYSQNDYEKEEDIGKMVRLQIDKCK